MLALASVDRHPADLCTCLCLCRRSSLPLRALADSVDDLFCRCVCVRACLCSCVVLESGTGSGSLTHALARAVAPSGHVHTFEFHPGRAEEAAAEFKAHGLASFITVQQRNIEDLGFPADMAGKADGVFLDLPRPQKVVASAAACLRPDGRFCSFSPCIEQVQRTAEALEAHGFVDVQMVECLLRNYVVKAERLSANVVGGPPPAGHTGAGKAQGSGRKRARPDDEPEGDGEDGSVAVLAAEAGEAAGGEAQAMAQGDAAPAAGAGGTQQGHAAVTAATGTAAAVAGQKAPAPQAQPQPVMAVLAYPEVEARGHTGYLLFARKFVRADGTGATIATAAPATGADEVPAETPADTPAAAATNAEPSISCEVPSNDGQ